MFLTANPTNFEAEKVRSETRIRLNLHLDDGPLLSLRLFKHDRKPS